MTNGPEPPHEIDLAELVDALDGTIVAGIAMLAAAFGLGLALGLALGWWLL